jgi:hypothetical protein
VHLRCWSTYGTRVTPVNATAGGYPGTVGTGGTGCYGGAPAGLWTSRAEMTGDGH